MHDLVVGTTVGNTRYLGEWFEGISKLNPSTILISMDKSRHDKMPPDLPAKIFSYDTGINWENYEKRHKMWISDYSIGIGIKEILSQFVKTDCNHVIIIDSDIIVDEGLAHKIRDLDFDYLQIGVPAIAREGRFDFIDIFWKSSNFGISKKIARNILPKMNFTLDNCYPVDRNIHKMIKSLKPVKHSRIKSPGLFHYLNKNGKTIRVSTLNAQLHSIYTKPLITAKIY